VDGELEHGPFVSPYAYEWFIEGEASASQGRHGEAAMAFENAAAAPADDALLITRLAEEYELSGDSRRADRTLSAARRSYPSSPWVALAQGRIAQHRGGESEAIAAFIRARELAPRWDAPVIGLAETLIAFGRTERASAILLAYLGSSPHPRSERARSVLLDLARRSGDAETLARALALDPHLTPAARARETAELALEIGQPALAARVLAPALDMPENVALWLQALIQSGDRAEVASFLEGANRQGLGDLSERVDLLLDIGEARRALELLEFAAPSPKVGYATGRALLIAGNYVEAATILAEVPFGTASFEAARLAFADCSTAQGRPGAAAEALSQAPDYSLAIRKTLAGIYLEEGALRAGLRLFDPKRNLDRAALASLFERAGHFEEAAAYYAAVQAPGLDEARLHARASAERLASRGNRRAAIAVLERWTAAAPDDLYARVRLVELLAADDQVEVAQQSGGRALEVIDAPRLRAHLIAVLERSASAE
jgi:thioredoxin-like negative regulator of GroEL